MWVIHHFSQSGCLSYLNFSQILSAVLTDSQNNIQQPREPDVLTVTHHMCGGGKQHLHTSNCLMWTETGKVWNAPKQTKKKALNLFTAMLWKIEIHLFEMSDMNDATKEKKTTFTHFLQMWTRAKEIYNQHVCVYSCRINHKKMRWWITLTLYHSWMFALKLNTFPTASLIRSSQNLKC